MFQTETKIFIYGRVDAPKPQWSSSRSRTEIYGSGPTSQNDEIVIPSFSFISTANSVLFVGATPKFADIEYDSIGMEPYDLRIKFSVKNMTGCWIVLI